MTIDRQRIVAVELLHPLSHRRMQVRTDRSHSLTLL